MHHRPPVRRPHPAADPEPACSILLCIAQLMVILDISAVNVALPDMAKDLDIGGGDIGWTITSYSLIFGSLLLLGGRAADLLGRRRVFLTGLGVFTLASLASALAGGAATLFAARAGQGLGAAMLSPAALSIIMAAFTQGRERAKALGAWGAVGGAGAAVRRPARRRAHRARRLAPDLPHQPARRRRARRRALQPCPPTRCGRSGAASISAARCWRPLSLGALVFALSQADSAGWTSTQTLGLGAAALAGLAAFAALELRTAQPLLRVQRLGDRGVGGGSLMMLAASAVLFGSFLLSSLYLQNVLGTGPLETGLAFLPLAAAIAVGVHLGTHVIGHAGVRVPLAGALAVTAGGMLLLTGVDAGGSYVADVLPGMLIAGVGLGVALVGVSVSVLTGAGEEETGMLSGLNTTGHEIGGSLGIAVLATIATGSLGGAGSAAALTSGIGDAFLVAGAVAAVASVARAGDPALRRQLPAQAPALTARLRPLTTMPPTRPLRRADAQRSFESILDAALDALASDPDASMAEIARRAGVVRATIYVHFPTREALIAAVTERAVAEVTQAIEAAEPTRGEARDALERVVLGGVEEPRPLPRPRRGQPPASAGEPSRHASPGPRRPAAARRTWAARRELPPGRPGGVAPLDAARARPRRQRRALGGPDPRRGGGGGAARQRAGRDPSVRMSAGTDMVVVIGGGQAGLAIGYHLAAAGPPVQHPGGGDRAGRRLAEPLGLAAAVHAGPLRQPAGARLPGRPRQLSGARRGGRVPHGLRPALRSARRVRQPRPVRARKRRRVRGRDHGSELRGRSGGRRDGTVPGAVRAADLRGARPWRRPAAQRRIPRAAATSRTGRCWSWAAGTPGSRSPRSSPGRERSISRWALARRRSRSASSAATCSATSRPPV